MSNLLPLSWRRARVRNCQLFDLSYRMAFESLQRREEKTTIPSCETSTEDTDYEDSAFSEMARLRNDINCSYRAIPASSLIRRGAPILSQEEMMEPDLKRVKRVLREDEEDVDLGGTLVSENELLKQFQAQL